MSGVLEMVVQLLALLLILQLQAVYVTGESCANGSTLNVDVHLESVSELDKSILRQESLKLNFTLQSVDGKNAANISFKRCHLTDTDKNIFKLLERFSDKVHMVRKEWTHHDVLLASESKHMLEGINELRPANQVCEDYYGFGVEAVWTRGYTGKQVTVAILDVGVNVELEDLKQNIDRNRCFNFVHNNTDVRPEYYDILTTSASPMTDHGNQIASIVAATKGNNLCSAGIAYNATLRVRKIFIVRKGYGGHFGVYPYHWTSSGIFSRAISQDFIDTDVIIMAWAPTEKKYDNLNWSTARAIEKTATEGRHGRGTLMFVPTGPVGNGLANTVYTITVGGMSKEGGIPNSEYADASVLTSGLTEGNNLTSSNMVTTTLSDRCVNGFKGVSAATAQIAAIAALVLEANASLSRRDVNHIFVRASNYRGLKESRSFIRNGAGHFYHGILGFGLLDASKAVTLAERWVPVSNRVSKSFIHYQKTSSRLVQTFQFHYGCILEFEKVCLTKVEEVEVKIRLPSISEIHAIEVVSPSGTRSVLHDPSLSSQSVEPDVQRNPTDAELLSVHFWDETAIGHWQVRIQLKPELSVPMNVESVTLKIHGTANSTVDGDDISHDASSTTTTKSPVVVPTTHTATKKPEKNKGNVLGSNYLVFVAVMLCYWITSVIYPD